jgi:translation elongation factor EF-Ts
MTPLEEATKIVKSIRAIRDFSGEGLMDCKKALRSANGDPLLAVGILRASGLCVNIKGDRQAWNLRNAEGYAKTLELTEDGAIVTIQTGLENLLVGR